MQDAFAKALQDAINLSNRAAGRTDSRSLRDQTKAAAQLLDLTRRMRGRPPLERWNVRRHYYRAIGDYRRLIALGHAEVARGNKLGVLSVGFGHFDEGVRLWRAGQRARAKSHALAACEAFKKILRIDALAMAGSWEQAAAMEARAVQAGLSAPELKQLRAWFRELQKG